MSCGDPHEVDCGRLLEEVDLFLDGEMGPGDVRRIQAHIDACAPCLDLVQVERIVKALVARSCREHAPEQLRQRILVSLTQVVLEVPRV